MTDDLAESLAQVININITYKRPLGLWRCKLWYGLFSQNCFYTFVFLSFSLNQADALLNRNIKEEKVLCKVEEKSKIREKPKAKAKFGWWSISHFRYESWISVVRTHLKRKQALPRGDNLSRTALGFWQKNFPKSLHSATESSHSQARALSLHTSLCEVRCYY